MEAEAAHRLFEAQAASSPDATAAVFEGRSLSYSELNARANRLAHYLMSRGVGPETLVGVCVEKSFDLVVGLLGVFKSGGAYVPIDPSIPTERIRFILEDARVSLLLTQERLLEKVPRSAPVVCLDRDSETFPREERNPSIDITPENLAYVIYTSGSTGKPKGVLLEHAGLYNLARNEPSIYGIGPGSRVLQFFSIGFDASMTELFMTLSSGATLILPNREQRVPGLALASFMNEQRVTVAIIPPPVLSVLPRLAYPSIETVISGGAVCTADIVERWAPGRRFFNVYGPTEATVSTTFEKCEPNGKAPPIGRPGPNKRVYILDAQGKKVPAGVAGELHIGGAGIARGYLNRPELTKQKFIPDPFSEDPKARLYKTGDVCRWLPDGKVEYLGRMDSQVKLRGFRIELGEIEGRLCDYPKVSDAAVILREDRPGEKRLVAYLVPSKGETVDVADLKRHVKRFLPDYMVPSAFVVLAEWPMTVNGKVDRKALPPPECESSDEFYVAPRTPAERALAQIMAGVLGVQRVGASDNFFALGGDSISVLRLVDQVRSAGFSINERQVFEAQTLADLARSARTISGERAEEGTVTGAIALTPIQTRFFAESGRGEHPGFYQSVLIELDANVRLEALKAALDGLWAHHDALRIRFEETPRGWQQSNLSPGERDSFPLIVVDVPDRNGEETRTFVRAEAARIGRDLDFRREPLASAVLFTRRGASGGHLLILLHSLVSDFVSWGILLEDLAAAYGSIVDGGQTTFPPKTTSFRDWASYLTNHARSELLASETHYWQQARSWEGQLPVDHPGRWRASFASAEKIELVLDPGATRALLQDLPSVRHARIDEALLTALSLTLGSWTGKKELRLDIEGNGREGTFGELNLARTVGRFTHLFPALLRLPQMPPIEALQATKSQLREVPRHGIGYGVLRYLRQENSLEEIRGADLYFTYLGARDLKGKEPSDRLGRIDQHSDTTSESPWARSYLLGVTNAVRDGALVMTWTYHPEAHARETVEKLATGYRECLVKLMATCLERTSVALPGPRLSDDFSDLKGPIDYVVNAQISARRTKGAVVAILRNGARAVWRYGSVKAGSMRAPDANSVFRVGSVTKTFTGILFADAVRRGLVGLDDKISAEHLIPELRDTSVADITLRELATHMSGLPPYDGGPSKSYSLEEALQYLSPPFQLGPKPSSYSRVNYSSLGVGILGLAVTRANRMDYETLLKERICDPLSMHDTSITLSELQKKRLLQPHNEFLEEWPVSFITGISQAEGAIFSTVNDLMRYVSANLHPPRSPLGEALALSHEVHACGVPENSGLIWVLGGKGGPSEIWHQGGSGGVTNIVAFDPARDLALVAVVNSTYVLQGVEEIVFGKHYTLDLGLRLSEDEVSALLGDYDFGSAGLISVRWEKDYLFCTGLFIPARPERARLYGKSDLVFFLFDGLAWVTFLKDSQGEIFGMKLSVRGDVTFGKKMARRESPAPYRRAS